MFCCGSKVFRTPSIEAVSGMSCMRPRAPLREMACGLNADSTRITADTRRSGTP
jgi:hypothetical protein